MIYDEAYSIERDRAAARGRRHQRFYSVILPLCPLLGLLWSGFKNRILGQLGFKQGSITKASIVLTFNLFIAEGIFVGGLAGGILTSFLGRPMLRPVNWMLMLLLSTDSAMRFGQSLKMDVEHHWGFCDWLWPRKRQRDEQRPNIV